MPGLLVVVPSYLLLISNHPISKIKNLFHYVEVSSEGSIVGLDIECLNPEVGELQLNG